MIRRGLALFPAVALLGLAQPLAAGPAPTGQALVPITACRSVDTRGPAGPSGGPALGVNEVRIFTIVGTCGVPANALGLVVNVTVVNPAAPGYAQLFAGDAPVPPTTVLSFNTHNTRAGFAFVALAANGSGTVALANGSAGGADYLLDVEGYFVFACTSPIIVTNPATAAGAVNAPFGQTFTSSGGVGAKTYTTASPLPPGLTLAANGTLSGTPTQPGTFPITVTATDQNGCTGTGPTYTLVIACQTISVTNPGLTTGTANAPFSQTFTQTGGVGATTFSTVNALPIGMTLAANGVLSGTPTQAGGFDIVVTATDANGCTGSGATYHLVINCQTITVTNPATAAGTVNAAFSQTFTQAGAIGAATFSTTSTLPTGLALAANGVLSGTPTQKGTFPIVVKATDSNLCTGTGATYNLVIGCQTITVTNPGVTTATAGAAFSQTFTASNTVGSVAFSTASTLPTGLTLAANGVLSGTPTQTGTFLITVTATDANGCAGIGATYTLVVGCQTWSVGPATLPQGTTGVAYPVVTFTHSGGIGTVTFAETGTLPTGMGFVGGVLSGTPTQTGSFPITVTASDANGCTASRDYLLVVVCSGTSITLSPSSLPTVAAGSAFPSTTFTASGGTGPYAIAQAGALPAGMTFTVDTLAGTPTQTGTFPITISATDSGGCAGSQDYVVTVTCLGVTITVAPPTLAAGPVGTAYGPVTFTASGGTSPYTFAKTGALPPGMTFAAGVLSGTPTAPGSFPIAVTATDAAGCVGSTSYSLVTTCPTITVTSPSTTTGTVDAAFSQTFTQSGGAGSVTFSTTSTLPAGLTLSAGGVLSGTPGAPGTFPIVVKVTDANGCTGTGATYTLVISCQTISVTNPSTTTGTVDAAFSQIFTQTGGGTHTPVTFTTSSTLPSGLTLSSAGVLSGTPGQNGTFPIVVTATDANGCTGTGATYSLVISCQTITITNASATSASYNTALSPASNYTFTQAGVGTHTPATFTVASGTLPAGVSLTSAGVLTGTPTQTGTFTITVKATDANGCFGTGASYTLTVAPVAATDSYSGLVDNTQFVVTGGTTASPATPFVGTNGSVTFRLTNNDLPGGVTLTTGTFSTTAGGSVTIAADGTFIYTPKANPTLAAITSDSFTYTISSNTGGTPTAATAIGTVNLTLAGRVWYVKNNGLAGNGQSQSPFQTLASAASASTASDILYVYFGDGTTANQNAGITLKNSQVLTGEGVALVVGSNTLRAAGSSPSITNTSGNVVTLANGNTIQGLTLTGSANALVAGGSGVTGTTNLNTVVMTPTGSANGVSLTSQAAGHTFIYNSGSITASSSGAAVLLSGASGAGSATFAIAISQSTGKAIDISSRTADTVAFNAAVSSTGQGISLTNNTGSTISFTGGLSLSTGANAAFTATGGGTVTATQNNGSILNTLTTTTGTALNVANTTIGAAGLTFRSISANGATNGIVLNNTGASAGLTVTGDAGSANNSSGGTIQNITNVGISLTNTRNVSLDQMNIQSTTHSGIDGTQVTNFAFTNGTINAAGNQLFESCIAFNGTNSQVGNNIAGTLTVTGSTLTNPFYSGLDIQSDNGTITNADVSNNTITNTGGLGINFSGINNASTVFNLQNATINHNNITQVGGTGIQAQCSASNTTGPGAVCGVPGDATKLISITNNTVAPKSTGTQAITVANSGGNPASRTKTNFLIQCNGNSTGSCNAVGVLNGSSIGTVILIGNNGYADMTGIVDQNTVVANHTANLGGGNGIAGGNGVAGAGNAWTPNLTLTVTNNTISQTDGNGILLVGRGTSGTFGLKISNNSAAAPINAGGTARQGIRVDAGNAASADDSVCLHIFGNTSAGSNGAAGIGVRKNGAVSTTNDFGIQGIGIVAPTNAQVQTFINTQNPGGSGTDIISGSNYVDCGSAP